MIEPSAIHKCAIYYYFPYLYFPIKSKTLYFHWPIKFFKIFFTIYKDWEGCKEYVGNVTITFEIAHALEQVCEYCVEDMHQHKKELVQIISRHLSSDNARILFPLAELLLLMSRPHGSRTLMILATKVIFKLARDDLNDNLFMSRRTLELLLTSLGNHCPKKDSEAFVYAYGGLKFLTLNGQISQLLSGIY